MLEILKEQKKDLAQRWVSNQNVQAILLDKKIDLHLFENHYALGVIEYLIDILKHEKKIGNCPIIEQLLKSFCEHHITSKEIFLICAESKNVIINFAFEQEFATQNSINEIMHIMNQNFAGVIKIYDDLLNEHKQKFDVKNQKFVEYLKAVDIANIVSKTDLHGNITYVNRAFEEISGFSAQELVGRSHSVVSHQDNERSIFKIMWETILDKDIFYGVFKNRNKNGSEYYLKTFIIPIMDLDGNITEFLRIQQDITEILHVNEKEKNLNAMKDELIRNLSHEIRTPLNAIISMSGLISKNSGQIETKLQRSLSLIMSGAEKIEDILTQIIDFSEVCSDLAEPDFSVVILENLFKDFLEEYKYLEMETGISFSYHIDPSVKDDFWCDFKLIKELLDPLIKNAFKFNSLNGTVQIDINYKNSNLLITVKDSGIGIDESEFENIYETFYQIHRGLNRRYEGFGLGLAKVKRVLNLLQGTILVQSKLGETTTFKVNIPLMSVH